jgi:chromosome segregation ATPase
MNADTNILENQIKGLRDRLIILRIEEGKFLMAKGLEEEIEALIESAGTARTKLAEAKKTLAALKEQKAQAVAGTVEKLGQEMGRILPEGEGVMKIEDDGSVTLAWKNRGGRVVPYSGLSGGQRILYDAALAHALLGNATHPLLILEAAELDETRLAQALEHIAATNPAAQLLVNTCHNPAAIPAGWAVVDLTAAA